MSVVGWNAITNTILNTDGRLCLMSQGRDICIEFYDESLPLVRLYGDRYYICDLFTGNGTYTKSAEEVIGYIQRVLLLPLPTLPKHIREQFSVAQDNKYVKIKRNNYRYYHACEEYVWMDDKPNYRIIQRGEPIEINGKTTPYDLETLIAETRRG